MDFVSLVKAIKGLWPKGLTEEFYVFLKSRKRSIFVIDSYWKDSAFTAVKRDVKKGCKVLNKVCERGAIFQ